MSERDVDAELVDTGTDGESEAEIGQGRHDTLRNGPGGKIANFARVAQVRPLSDRETRHEAGEHFGP